MSEKVETDGCLAASLAAYVDKRIGRGIREKYRAIGYVLTCASLCDSGSGGEG